MSAQADRSSTALDLLAQMVAHELTSADREAGGPEVQQFTYAPSERSPGRFRIELRIPIDG